MITPEPPAGSEHYQEGWRHGYEQAAIDRERSANAVRLVPATLNSELQVGAVPDTGQARADRRALDDIAEACGARAGDHRDNVVMVVRSMLQDPATFEARRVRALDVARRLVDSLDQLVSESGDPGAEALGALYEGRRFLSDGGGSGDTVQAPDVAALVADGPLGLSGLADALDSMVTEHKQGEEMDEGWMQDIATQLRAHRRGLLGTDTTPEAGRD